MITQKLQILIDAQDRASKKLDKVKGKMEGMKAGMRKVGIAATVMGGAMTAGFAMAVKEAAKAEGSLNKFKAVFAENTEEMTKFIDELRKTMPTARTDIIRMAADLQDLLVPLGLSREKAMGLSQGFLDLSNKIAAFNDVNPTEVLAAIKSGLVGSSEPLLKYGVDTRVTTLEVLAMNEGLLEEGQKFKDLTPETMAQVRAQAIFLQITKQSSDAIEGFAENQDSFIRRQQELQASFKDVSKAIGDVLLPILDDLLKKLLPVIENIKNWIEENPELTAKIVKIAAAIGVLMLVLGPLLIILPGIISAFTILTGPIGLVIGAITLLSAAITLVIRNWKKLVESIKSFGGIGKVISAIGEKVGGVFGFAAGGIVPGPIGQPQLAMVHGGEMIIPPGKEPAGNTFNFDFSGANISDPDKLANDIIGAINRASELNQISGE